MSYSGPWRVVNSLTTLRVQLDSAFPGRSHASDGTIADDLHSTTSDHYPHKYPTLGATPVVCAFDGTHDPAHGLDNRTVCESIRVSRDARVKYVISWGEIFSSYDSGSRKAWEWGPYTGSDDPHKTHFHVSVVNTAIADSIRAWMIGADMPLTPEEYSEIVQGNLTNDNVMHYRLRGANDGEDPGLSAYYAKGWAKLIGNKQLADKLAAMDKKIDGLATGGVTQDMLNAAVLNALQDPATKQVLIDAAKQGANLAEDA